MRPGLVVSVCAVLLGSLAGCGDNTFECATTAHADGSVTLALDGYCLERVTARHLDDGTWRDTGTTLAWRPVAGGLELTLSADGPTRALELAIPDVAIDRMLQQGYQSWSFAGAVIVPAMVPLDDDDGGPQMKAARTGDVFDERRGVSYHAALFRKGEDGPVLLVAALSADRAVTGIAATRALDADAQLSIIYGPQRERLRPDRDGRVRSEPLYLATAATPEAALAKLSDQLVRVRAAVDGFTPKRPPGGWFSWNSAFASVDASFVRSQLDVAQQALLPAGLPLVEIDDGWEVAWGDWRENAKFPDGLPALAAEIRARGLVAGVWLAPFLVDVTSAPAGADPSLFVRGPDGAPLVHQPPGLAGSFYVLDGTNPAAMALVTDHVRRLAAGGFTFFKLDFLYAGAFAGQRAEDVTGVEALRAGLAQIREAAGPDAILNACGAPTVPVLGLADSLRIGPDTAFADVPVSFMMVASATRSLAVRAHLWPVVWPDADQTQVRPPLTLDEARVSAVAAALAGAPYALGDDLVTLDPDRLALALDPVVVDLAGAAAPATFEGIMDAPTDVIVAGPILENGIVTPPPATFHATGKSGTTYQIEVDWLGARTVTITP